MHLNSINSQSNPNDKALYAALMATNSATRLSLRNVPESGNNGCLWIFSIIASKKQALGGVVERLIAPVLKTGDATSVRGFESHPLRHLFIITCSPRALRRVSDLEPNSWTYHRAPTYLRRRINLSTPRPNIIFTVRCAAKAPPKSGHLPKKIVLNFKISCITILPPHFNGEVMVF